MRGLRRPRLVGRLRPPGPTRSSTRPPLSLARPSLPRSPGRGCRRWPRQRGPVLLGSGRCLGARRCNTRRWWGRFRSLGGWFRSSRASRVGCLKRPPGSWTRRRATSSAPSRPRTSLPWPSGVSISLVGRTRLRVLLGWRPRVRGLRSLGGTRLQALSKEAWGPPRWMRSSSRGVKRMGERERVDEADEARAGNGEPASCMCGRPATR